ncbi:coiled-coil domain-containing glutamate-rich protein 1 [Suricata suricatta]|uniref:Coiled-coil glutamate rich protein 1 n=1 Tax=Suricata suricatta TaxID=37032 RepID=A0A673TNM8_SURSU|nr:coiled-coil domain-containing glutamate-rich protein 1 [Suricata suricatta]
MTQMLDKREDPLNLGGGCASSAPSGAWSSCHRRRRGAPVNKPRHRKFEYEAPRKQPKQQHGPGPWFQPPRWPQWEMYSNWGCWGGPWRPPPGGFWKPPGQVQVIGSYWLHPLCLCCCCSCWRGPWIPGWAGPPGRKKRWGRRGRGLRRHPRRSFPRSPPVDLSGLLRPVNLYGWRAPGMRAPRNTTQFIMNQVYEDMRQQEKLERQQEALRAQQAQASPEGASANLASPGGGEDDAELPEALYGFVQNPSLVFTPDQSPTAQPREQEEDEEKNEEECDEMEYGKEEESEEEGEEEGDKEGEKEGEEEEEEGGGEEEEEQEMEEEEGVEEEEEGVEEEEQREEENHLPLEMPLSFLVGAEEERENFINCAYFSPEQIIPKMPQEALLMLDDINC